MCIYITLYIETDLLPADRVHRLRWERNCWCFIFRGSCWFPKERKNQRLVDKARCRWGENEILFSRRVDWDTCLHAQAQHTKEETGHGPTECPSILSYMVASHGVPRLQTILFCFDYIWSALYRLPIRCIWGVCALLLPILDHVCIACFKYSAARC